MLSPHPCTRVVPAGVLGFPGPTVRNRIRESGTGPGSQGPPDSYSGAQLSPAVLKEVSIGPYTP